MDVCASQMKPLADILSKEDWANVSSKFRIFYFLEMEPMRFQLNHSFYVSSFHVSTNR
jgi:hypothetical protein